MRWNFDGERSWIEYEPDPQHTELIVKSLNMETTPSVKMMLDEVLSTFWQLDASQTRHYRSVVMRAAYLSQDRPDLSYSAKELARDMQQPTERSMTNLKRLGRYLKERSRLVQLFVEQTCSGNDVRLDVYGDSDHTGCLKTHESTTGVVMMRDAHCLKVSSHKQSTISLSIGESEYYGIVDCAAFGSGARSMLADFGMCADVVVRTDSSSGLAVSSRRGLGRLWHVHTRYLWVQQRVQQGDSSLEEGAGRHERERRAHRTSGRATHDDPVYCDGLRVQRWANIAGARGAMTSKIDLSSF